MPNFFPEHQHTSASSEVRVAYEVLDTRHIRQGESSIAINEGAGGSNHQ